MTRPYSVVRVVKGKNATSGRERAFKLAETLLNGTRQTDATTASELDKSFFVVGRPIVEARCEWKNDVAGRRTSMTVLGQPAVTYAYDNANRLLQISQGASAVTMTYDDAGRLNPLTLPNGVRVSYGYDAASRLMSINYDQGTTHLGDLAYQYDAAGRRTRMSGSSARANLPAPVASATYDAANELTQWGAATLSYDADGNLSNDGTNLYAWNARNQLASMGAASFQYDGFSRRTVNGAGTSFLYDGMNPVQELSGATPTANLLTGGVDQIFARTDSAGTRNFLTDALGSTLALTDSSGVRPQIHASPCRYGPLGSITFRPSRAAISANEWSATTNVSIRP